VSARPAGRTCCADRWHSLPHAPRRRRSPGRCAAGELAAIKAEQLRLAGEVAELKALVQRLAGELGIS
jgi:hypothetical protein